MERTEGEDGLPRLPPRCSIMTKHGVRSVTSFGRQGERKSSAATPRKRHPQKDRRVIHLIPCPDAHGQVLMKEPLVVVKEQKTCAIDITRTRWRNTASDRLVIRSKEELCHCRYTDIVNDDIAEDEQWDTESSASSMTHEEELASCTASDVREMFEDFFEQYWEYRRGHGFKTEEDIDKEDREEEAKRFRERIRVQTASRSANHTPDHESHGQPEFRLGQLEKEVQEPDITDFKNPPSPQEQKPEAAPSPVLNIDDSPGMFLVKLKTLSPGKLDSVLMWLNAHIPPVVVTQLLKTMPAFAERNAALMAGRKHHRAQPYGRLQGGIGMGPGIGRGRAFGSKRIDLPGHTSMLQSHPTDRISHTCKDAGSTDLSLDSHSHVQEDWANFKNTWLREKQHREFLKDLDSYKSKVTIVEQEHRYYWPSADPQSGYRIPSRFEVCSVKARAWPKVARKPGEKARRHKAPVDSRALRATDLWMCPIVSTLPLPKNARLSAVPVTARIWSLRLAIEDKFGIPPNIYDLYMHEHGLKIDMTHKDLSVQEFLEDRCVLAIVPHCNWKNLATCSMRGTYHDQTSLMAELKSTSGSDDWIQRRVTTAVNMVAYHGHYFILFELLKEFDSHVLLNSRLVLPFTRRISAIDRLPLHCAARKGHWKCLCLLLEKGSDLRLQDGNGKIAEMLAEDHTHPACHKTLQYCTRNMLQPHPASICELRSSSEKVIPRKKAASKPVHSSRKIHQERGSSNSLGNQLPTVEAPSESSLNSFQPPSIFKSTSDRDPVSIDNATQLSKTSILAGTSGSESCCQLSKPDIYRLSWRIYKNSTYTEDDVLFPVGIDLLKCSTKGPVLNSQLIAAAREKRKKLTREERKATVENTYSSDYFDVAVGKDVESVPDPAKRSKQGHQKRDRAQTTQTSSAETSTGNVMALRGIKGPAVHHKSHLSSDGAGCRTGITPRVPFLSQDHLQQQHTGLNQSLQQQQSPRPVFSLDAPLQPIFKQSVANNSYSASDRNRGVRKMKKKLEGSREGGSLPSIPEQIPQPLERAMRFLHPA